MNEENKLRIEFNENRLLALSGLDGMIELLNMHEKYLKKQGWDVKTIKTKIDLIYKILDEEFIMNQDTKLTDLEIEVPVWIEQDITVGDIEAINQGGCSSGAYMPAVSYYDARKTMGEHGDDVLEYIYDMIGEIPSYKNDPSWSGLCVHYLSLAVELYADEVESILEDNLMVEDTLTLELRNKENN